MINIMNMLTKNDFLLLSIFALVVMIISAILMLYINKRKKEPVIMKYVEKEKKIKSQPIIKMALAADNIEDIEKIIKNEDKKIKEQDMNNQNILENVLKAMNEDLEKERYAKIDAYEEEQEKEAVITYQELRNKMNQKNDYKEEENYNNTFFDILDKNEKSMNEEIITPIDYNINFSYNLPDEEQITSETVINESLTTNKIDYSSKISETAYNNTIETSEFISPIFGKQNNNQFYSEIEKNDNIKDLSLASDTDEFLNTLKEFRNSL